jgi:hypothetical protein
MNSRCARGQRNVEAVVYEELCARALQRGLQGDSGLIPQPGWRTMEAKLHDVDAVLRSRFDAPDQVGRLNRGIGDEMEFRLSDYRLHSLQPEKPQMRQVPEGTASAVNGAEW